MEKEPSKLCLKSTRMAITKQEDNQPNYHHTHIYIYIYIYNTIYMYSGITSGRVLNGELLYTKILEVNLFAFAYRLFRRDFSPLDGTYCIHNVLQYVPSSGEKSLRNSL